MNWTKLEPIKANMVGCLNCGILYDKAPMEMIISVGFGVANVTKDGEEIYREIDYCSDNFKEWTVQDAENEALKDPDHDWRISLIGGLRGRVFQRHGNGEWLLVEENMGFA